MEQQHIQALFDRFDNGTASEADIREIEALIAAGKINTEDFGQFEALFGLVDSALEQNDRIAWSDRFYNSLEQVRSASTRTSPRRRWMLIPVRYAAAGILLLGLALGWALHGMVGPSHDTGQQDQLGEFSEHQFMSLINDRSAPTRLKAVLMTTDNPVVSGAMLETLMRTVESDRSTNVRLAALDALADHADDPRVRSALLHALQQEMPMVQLRAAEILVAHNETGALRSIETLLSRQELSPQLHRQLLESIEQLKI